MMRSRLGSSLFTIGARKKESQLSRACESKSAREKFTSRPASRSPLLESEASASSRVRGSCRLFEKTRSERTKSRVSFVSPPPSLSPPIPRLTIPRKHDSVRQSNDHTLLRQSNPQLPFQTSDEELGFLSFGGGEELVDDSDLSIRGLEQAERRTKRAEGKSVTL